MLSLVSLVQFSSVLPFFTSTESQEFNSDIGVRNGTRQCALRPVLRFEMALTFTGALKMKNVFSKKVLDWPKYGICKFSAKFFFMWESTYSRATRVWPLLEVYSYVPEVDHSYYVPSKLEVNLCPSLYSLTEVILQLTMISLSVRGWFISRKMIHNPAKIRVIKYPLTDSHWVKYFTQKLQN